MVDPNLKEPIGKELQAVEAGYSELRQEIATFLGPLSLGQGLIEQRKQEAKSAYANRQFLVEFGRSLPVADKWLIKPHLSSYEDHYTFTLKDDNIQSGVRLIQANVLWIEMSPNDRSAKPYYIVGRRSIEAEPNSEELLLLGAEKSDEFNSKLITKVVRKDDMKARDEFVERLKVRELTDDEIDKHLNALNGTYVLNKEAAGTVAARNARAFGVISYQKEASVEFIENTDTVRYPKHTGIVSRYLKSISEAALLDFNVDEILAKLAFDFGQEDTLRDLMHENPSDKEKIGLSYEQLLEQNQELRTALKGIMIATGLVSEDEIDDVINNRYPSFINKGSEETDK
jgi:hypothetical protein